MCSVCGRNPCDSRCPNADEAPVFARCEICGEPIYDGDDYYDIDNEYWCEECVHNARHTAEVEY